MATLFNEAMKEALKESYYLFGLEKLNEASINRILKHGEEEGFVILSANRSSISNDWEGDIDHIIDKDNDSLLRQYVSTIPSSEISIDDFPEALDSSKAKEWLRKRNKDADEELKKDIQKKGYSYSEVFGGYHGTDDVIDSYEPSYIVYNRDRKGHIGDMMDLIRFAIRMCGKYHQDSVYIKRPGEAPVYVDKDGNKVSNGGSVNTKINREDEEFYTTTKRDKNAPKRFTSDIEFPEDEDYVPEKIFENKFYRKNIEYTEKLKKRQKGEILI